MTWKTELAQIILEIDQDEFTSRDIWKYLDRLMEIFPNANFPTSTVMNTLGTLRDAGAIEFVSRGRYRLTPDGKEILAEIGKPRNWHWLINKNWDTYYPQYTESIQWKDKRDAVLKRDGHLCICGATATVVHHKRYDNVGKEPLSDLVSLCENCHTDIHVILKERRGW